MKYLINGIIILFPLQYFALGIGTTKFDIFNIVFFLLFPIATFWNKLNRNRLLVVGCFLMFSLILTLNSSIQYPIYRFYSSFFWLLLTVFTFVNSYDFYTPKLFNLINSIGLIILLGIFFQKFMYPDLRPKLFFSEPSVAGLIMYSYSFLSFYLVFIKDNLKLNLLKGIAFFVAGILTESSHIITFTLMMTFVLLSNFKFRHFLILFILGFFTLVYLPESLVDKFSFQENVENYSFSQLSWLQGYNQAIASVKLNYFLGQGFGSTGYLRFYSDYEKVLEKSDLADLNRFDGYSLFFRWVIELGFVVTVLIVLYFVRILIKGLQKENISKYDRFVLFIFGFSIFLGSLLKEPNYGFSTFLLSFYLMGMFINTKMSVNTA
jgi:hypothetical protein